MTKLINTQNPVFPADFLWGASLASHQVEGGTHNQWSVWELQVANSQAKNAHQKYGWLANWPDIKAQAEDPNNYVSGKGVDHYHRYQEDFDLARDLHLNSLRFGIEWSRLEPEEGVFDDDQWQHYRRYMEELNKRGIEPVLNIWHWTMPVWFTQKGAFEKSANLKYFKRFVDKLCQELDLSYCRYILTLNEPNVFASFGYIVGEWPPNQKSLPKMIVVYYNLARAHRASYKIIKKYYPKLQVGIAAQLADMQAKRPHNFLDELTTQWMRYAWNWWFLNRIRRYQDFVGFNFYFTDYFQNFKRLNPKVPVSDQGWYMEPEGLYPLLLRVWAHYKKPILITENGLADAKDENRSWWIDETMLAMEKAILEGVEVKGYFHWSLLDNFEWAYGWWPKFGLVEVDRENGMKRTVRPSALRWGQQLKKLRQPRGKS